MPYKCNTQYGFTEWNGTCYTLIDWDPMLRKTYSDSEIFCSAFGFNLLVVRGVSERRYVENMLYKAKDLTADNFWIGGRVGNNSGTVILCFLYI